MSRFIDLVAHLRTHALRTDGPFTLRSGASTDWYIDARQTTLDGQGAWLVGEAILTALRPDVAAVGGLTMGADPIAVATVMAAVSHSRSLRAFTVRKASKDHGLAGRLVGPVTTGDRVAVLEDTTTTGSALMEAVDVASEAGLVVVQAIALCDRSDGRVGELMAGRSIPYEAVVVPSDLGVS